MGKLKVDIGLLAEKSIGPWIAAQNVEIMIACPLMERNRVEGADQTKNPSQSVLSLRRSACLKHCNTWVSVSMEKCTVFRVQVEGCERNWLHFQC